MNTTSSTYLLFEDGKGHQRLVSIESILDGGNPMDEDGNEMDLVSSELVDWNSDPI